MIELLVGNRWAAQEKGIAIHPNKHIREAIEYAQAHGWRFTKAGARAHIFGTLWCPLTTREGCRFRVFSTPRHPDDHARDIRRAVDGCGHEDTQERLDG